MILPTSSLPTHLFILCNVGLVSTALWWVFSWGWCVISLCTFLTFPQDWYECALLSWPLSWLPLTSPSSSCWFLTSSTTPLPSVTLLVRLAVLKALTVHAGKISSSLTLQTSDLFLNIVHKFLPCTPDSVCLEPSSFSSSLSAVALALDLLTSVSGSTIFLIVHWVIRHLSWFILAFSWVWPIFHNQEVTMEGMILSIYWVLPGCQTLLNPSCNLPRSLGWYILLLFYRWRHWN